VAVADALIEATGSGGPPIFFGNPGATNASVFAFWFVFYVWIGSEVWLGYKRRRRPSGAAYQDAGSKWWLISSIYVSVALGIGLAFGFPDAAIVSGRTVFFVVGLFLMVAGLPALVLDPSARRLVHLRGRHPSGAESRRSGSL